MDAPEPPPSGHPPPPGQPPPPGRAPQPTPSFTDRLQDAPGVAEGRAFVSFLKISARRAFRLRIEPSEVLPSERRKLEAASPPVFEPNLQAFLAWRRSVLFLVAVALVPLTILGFVNAYADEYERIRYVKLWPAIAEGVFALICWTQLLRWQHWRKQRRWLFVGWAIFMFTPFIVFALPLREIIEGSLRERRAALLAFDIKGAGAMLKQAVLPFVFAMIAMLQLAPKAISLMPGLIRGSMVIKLLFPGSAAPGWLIAIAAMLYALLIYVILIIPYQFTGDVKFMIGVGCVVAAQGILVRTGFRLARPHTEAEAVADIKRARKIYMTTMLVAAGFILVALFRLVDLLHLQVSSVFLAVFKFETNVLILTMVFSDLVVTNLDRARSQTQVRSHVEEETEIKIAAFVGLDAPPVPPPKH